MGADAGEARVDETRIDTGLRVDASSVDNLRNDAAGKGTDSDDEPRDQTRIDEFRLPDLNDDATAKIEVDEEAKAELKALLEADDKAAGDGRQQGRQRRSRLGRLGRLGRGEGRRQG